LLNECNGLPVFMRPALVHDHRIPPDAASHRGFLSHRLESSVLVAPSIVMHAVLLSQRRELIIVVAHQCPCGALACRRSDLGLRPCSRVMFVFAADSSIKTILCPSSLPCSAFYSCLACLMSSRSCSLARSVPFI
jgi:hypothetical protein